MLIFVTGVCVEKTYPQNRTCTTDMDCNNGTSCLGGLCTTMDPCISIQCQQEEFCQEGICIRDNNNTFIPCSQDEDCDEGFACSSLAICVDPFHPLHKCNEEVSCGSKAMCQTETCTPLPRPGKACVNFLLTLTHQTPAWLIACQLSLSSRVIVLKALEQL